MDVVRACHKCKLYVQMDESLEGKKRVKAFDINHRGHPLGMVNQDEVESYTRV